MHSGAPTGGGSEGPGPSHFQGFLICISEVCFLSFLLCGRTEEACSMVNSLRKVDFSHPTGHFTWNKIFGPSPLRKSWVRPCMCIHSMTLTALRQTIGIIWVTSTGIFNCRRRSVWLALCGAASQWQPCDPVRPARSTGNQQHARPAKHGHLHRGTRRSERPRNVENMQKSEPMQSISMQVISVSSPHWHFLLNMMIALLGSVQ